MINGHCTTAACLYSCRHACLNTCLYTCLHALGGSRRQKVPAPKGIHTAHMQTMASRSERSVARQGVAWHGSAWRCSCSGRCERRTERCVLRPYSDRLGIGGAVADTRSVMAARSFTAVLFDPAARRGTQTQTTRACTVAQLHPCAHACTYTCMDTHAGTHIMYWHKVVLSCYLS